MTSLEIDHLTNLANQVGRPFNVKCKYEWDRKKQRFQWNYYRHGRFIGGTANPKEVVARMDRYTTTKQERTIAK